VDKIVVKVPSRLILMNSIEFVKELKSLPSVEQYVFDFSDLAHIDPLSLLYVSSEIKNCRERLKESHFTAINYDAPNCSYMAFMGFFQSFGLPFGNVPGQAKGSSSYLPITLLDVGALKKNANEHRIHPAAYMEAESRKLAEILIRNSDQKLIEVLTYCFREIFRNVIEHSESKVFGYCAQYLQYKNEVSIAIIDKGIGLKESLLNNPRLEVKNDRSAIDYALSPGISGKVYAGQRRKPKGDWVNSGYGLFMTSNICKNGGNFFIASGSSGLLITKNNTKELNTLVSGTAINLTINTFEIKSLSKMLDEFRDGTFIENYVPSKSSMGLIDPKN
jgi:hypothetical protein